MAAPTQVRRIQVKMDAPGVKEALDSMAKSMGYLTKNTKSVADNMSFLTNAFRSWIGFLGVRELTRMSDQMQNFTNRLKVNAQAGEDVAVTLQKIADIADRTNQSVGEVGVVYNRMNQALKSSGANSKEVLALTESLINTFRISGATTTETSNGILQLSQAFNKGKLDGDEFRSVMEQNAVIADALKKKFGAQIYDKAASGAIRLGDIVKFLTEDFRKLSGQSAQLQPTFEQTLTKATNTLALTVGSLNDKFQLSAKFATLVGFAMENLGSILAIVTPMLILWASTYIPNLITQLNNLRIAGMLFFTSNPLLLAFTAITVGIGLLYANWDKFMNLVNRSRAGLLDFLADAEQAALGLRKSGVALFGGDTKALEEASQGRIKSFRDNAAAIRDMVKAQEEAAAAAKGNPGQLMTEQEKALKSLREKLNAMPKDQKPKKVKEMLAEFNVALDEGRISLQEYNKKLIDFELYKLNRGFREGKMDVVAYRDKLLELNIQDLTRQLKSGVISLNEFNSMLANEKISVLTEKFNLGKISLREYNEELTKLEDKFRPGSAFQAGALSYLESIGTLSQGIAKGIEQAFGHLEDNLFDFVKTGEFNFNKFAQSVLDDLTKIIIKASIMRPLVQGITGMDIFTGGGGDYSTTAGSGGGQGSYLMNAKGNAFGPGGVTAFANGGIVDNPTMFSYGRSKMGVMGEKGPEAILPLQRDGAGNLGVSGAGANVIVNVINQSGADVETKESSGPNGERVLDMIITSKVKGAFASGALDKEMKANYGISRRGT